jgi:hypothetical protein
MPREGEVFAPFTAAMRLPPPPMRSDPERIMLWT